MKKGFDNKLVLFLIPIGVAINFIGGQIAILLRLPLYLDAIGTIVVGALCGGIPGAIVGLVSNVLNSITSPITLWYGVLNVIFGLSAAWLSSRKFFLTFIKSMITVPWFAFVGGGIGAVMTWCLYGFDFGSGTSSLIAIPLDNIIHFPFLSQFIAEFGIDVFDKVLTLIAVYLVLKAMPTNLLAKLPLGHIYIKDVEE
ncbi:MAG: hypothetical protein LBR25_07035 [Erysipelotrichaceae bacterium]|jgi:energy-coupling factor transport system substrate-specific component|nr:hypothetical protein [Erysipelotrichaceae bacterium]